MAMSLTRRQSDLLDVIRNFMAERGYAPSFQEMGDALGTTSKGMVHSLIGGLEERGLIRRMPNRARCIELVDPVGNISTSDLIAELVRRGVSVPSAEFANPSAGDGAARPSSHDDALPRQPVSPTVHESQI